MLPTHYHRSTHHSIVHVVPNVVPRKFRLLIKVILPGFLCISLLWLVVSRTQFYSRSLRDPDKFRSFYLSGNSSTSLPLTAIKEAVYKINHEQRVWNIHLWNEVSEDTLPPSTPIIVVQIHNRGKYLEGLIYSLSCVRGIEQSLLVFSHDVWDDEINSLIRRRVSFVPYLQIFYPFSLQLYPNTFPGSDPRDCPRDMPPQEAVKVRCLNAHSPDAYGHYREAKYTQTKHHWWWKVNIITS